jgi:hypothetical protein
MNDREFVTAFEACAIAKADFHHVDHVRLAWIYLREETFIAAIERFTSALRRFAAHHDVPGLYHETMTWAYLVLINERIEQGGRGDDWESFRRKNPDLFATRPSILERYYTPRTLKSEIARRIFMLPDAPSATS